LNHRGSDLPTRVRPQRQAKQEAKVRLEKADKSSSGSSSSSSSGGGSSSGSEEESELESEEPTVSEVRQSSELPTTKSTEDSKSEAERVEEGSVSAPSTRKKRKGSTSEKLPPPSDEKRCRRSDGKKWQCAKERVEESIYCEYHTNYVRNKKTPSKPPKTPKVKEPKVKEPKVKEPKVKEPKVKEPKVKEPKVKEPKLNENGTESLNEKPRKRRTSRPADAQAEDPDASENDEPKARSGRKVSHLVCPLSDVVPDLVCLMQ
jgi:hypothetical protein